MGEEQKRIMLAVSLSAVVLFGWQHFFGPAPVTSSPESLVSVPSSPSREAYPERRKSQSQSQPMPQENKQKVSNSVFSRLSYKGHSFELSNDLVIKNAISPSQAYDYKRVVGENGFIKVQYIDESNTLRDPNIQWELISVNHLKGRDSDLGLSVEAKINEKGLLSLSMNSIRPHTLKFTTSAEKLEKEGNRVRSYALLLNGELEKFAIGDEEEGNKNLRWFGIDHEYHLFAATLERKEDVKYFASERQPLEVLTLAKENTHVVNFIYNKKEYDYLLEAGHNLNLAVDFGFFSVIAVPILKLLQWCYTVIPNYGVAIIFLTIFIRMVTFPFQYKSFKSMKKMSDIQPQLKKMKEKFKDDPARIQKETMELFKRNGVNPLGGCLPMLLQMPFIFAFYRVLYEAVELVDAPFIGWIQDLSVKDEYYVLPVLMAIAMAVNQKMQPSAATQDETQKKMMMFMPLVFGFIMKDFPAGLTLYIFVSTIFGIAQQQFVNKTA